MTEFYLCLPRLVRTRDHFLEWCNEHARDLTNTANVLYAKYVSGENFSAREQCLDFKRMEMECKKFLEKKNSISLITSA